MSFVIWLFPFNVYLYRLDRSKWQTPERNENKKKTQNRPPRKKWIANKILRICCCGAQCFIVYSLIFYKFDEFQVCFIVLLKFPPFEFMSFILLSDGTQRFAMSQVCERNGSCDGVCRLKRICRRLLMTGLLEEGSLFINMFKLGILVFFFLNIRIYSTIKWKTENPIWFHISKSNKSMSLTSGKSFGCVTPTSQLSSCLIYVQVYFQSWLVIFLGNAGSSRSICRTQVWLPWWIIYSDTHTLDACSFFKPFIYSYTVLYILSSQRKLEFVTATLCMNYEG